MLVPSCIGAAPRARSGPVSVVVVGATGSIGTTAVTLAERFPERLKIIGVVGRERADPLLEAARRCGANSVVLSEESSYAALKSAYSTFLAKLSSEDLPASRLSLEAGPESVTKLVTRSDVDVVLAAAMGMAGLHSVLAALNAGKRVALANKESLVAGGALVQESLERFGGTLIPVDSEHAALFSLLRNVRFDQVKHLVLTASGGPFLRRAVNTLKEVSIADAVKHPRWSMGAKISIDSATMMNKALELIEAVWLFGVEHQRVKVLIHPQSLVHGMLEMHDGSTIMHASSADMSGPIGSALCFPESIPDLIPSLSLPQLENLVFEEVEGARFPAIALARGALDAGGAACAVLNSSNEVAVHAFLRGAISFDRIVPLVSRALEELQFAAPKTPTELHQVDREVRAKVSEWCSGSF